MNLPIIILGSGGHAKVMIDVLRLNALPLLGVVNVDPENERWNIPGVTLISGDQDVLKYSSDTVYLVNGVGSVCLTEKRKLLFEKFKNLGYSFVNVIHPYTVIASDVKLLEGAQIMAGAIVQPGCVIGVNVIVNTRASIDHDCAIGDHVHVAPGVTVSGGVKIGEGAHIGTGATIIQGISIGKNSMVAAGSVAVRDVPEGVIIKGVPGREEST